MSMLSTSVAQRADAPDSAHLATDEDGTDAARVPTLPGQAM
jgi:hypothetical protein